MLRLHEWYATTTTAASAAALAAASGRGKSGKQKTSAPTAKQSKTGNGGARATTAAVPGAVPPVVVLHMRDPVAWVTVDEDTTGALGRSVGASCSHFCSSPAPVAFPPSVPTILKILSCAA